MKHILPIANIKMMLSILLRSAVLFVPFAIDTRVLMLICKEYERGKSQMIVRWTFSIRT